MNLLLLGTANCHLCERAEDIVSECFQKENHIYVERIDIAEQTQWQSKYATLIPVLLHVATNTFLNWPFTDGDVRTFIEQHHD